MTPGPRDRQPLERVIGDPMRERYEREVEKAWEHHQRMAREVAERLMLKHQILCIETQADTDITLQPAWRQFHPEQRRLYREAQYGGERPDRHAPMVRFMFGYEPGDERFAIWKASEGEQRPPVDIEGVDAVLVTGSAAMVTTMEDAPDSDEAQWMRRVADFLRATRRHNTPTLAVCFGHQLLAAAVGERVEWMKDEHGNPVREIGPAQLHLTKEARQDPLLQGLGDDFWVQASHSQEVATAGEQIQVLAHNPAGRNQLLRYCNDLQWSMQHHPEITAIATDMLLAMRNEVITAEIERMSATAKEQLGISSIDELRQRLIEQDTHEAREVLFLNFIRIIQEQLSKR